MAQLFVPLSGHFQQAAGSGYNTYGENLEWDEWTGAELGFLDGLEDVWGAVSEAEYHDWNIGVHHPLYIKDGPKWGRFFDRDAVVRAEALAVAVSAAEAAHHIGARYILFHFPWPGFQMNGVDHRAEGWYFTHPLEQYEEWQNESRVYEVSRRAFEVFAGIQEKEQIRVVLEIDGPNPHFFDGDMYSRLFTEYPDLSLCVDTGRLGLLAKTHGHDPLELCKRWLPWTRHLHLSTSGWDGQGKFFNHRPSSPDDRMPKWPLVTPAADLAEMVLKAQPKANVVLEHNPRAVSPEALAAAHNWVAALADQYK